MKKLTYVGMGPGSAGQLALSLAYDCGAGLAMTGWHLRSGGDKGLDDSFERGCDSEKGAKEIFIPSADFAGRRNANDKIVHCLSNHIPAMRFLLEKVEILNWKTFPTLAQMFMVRNVFALMGEDLKSPADMVITWNQYPNTGTAYLSTMATAMNIPVFNLRLADQLDAIETFVAAKEDAAV